MAWACRGFQSARQAHKFKPMKLRRRSQNCCCKHCLYGARGPCVRLRAPRKSTRQYTSKRATPGLKKVNKRSERKKSVEPLRQPNPASLIPSKTREPCTSSVCKWKKYLLARYLKDMSKVPVLNSCAPDACIFCSCPESKTLEALTILTQKCNGFEQELRRVRAELSCIRDERNEAMQKVAMENTILKCEVVKWKGHCAHLDSSIKSQLLSRYLNS